MSTEPEDGGMAEVFSEVTYLLPGKYAYMRKFEDASEVITFQTLEEMLEYIDEQTPDDDGDDDEGEEWKNAS